MTGFAERLCKVTSFAAAHLPRLFNRFLLRVNSNRFRLHVLMLPHLHQLYVATASPASVHVQGTEHLPAPLSEEIIHQLSPLLADMVREAQQVLNSAEAARLNWATGACTVTRRAKCARGCRTSNAQVSGQQEDWLHQQAQVQRRLQKPQRGDCTLRRAYDEQLRARRCRHPAVTSRPHLPAGGSICQPGTAHAAAGDTPAAAATIGARASSVRAAADRSCQAAVAGHDRTAGPPLPDASLVSGSVPQTKSVWSGTGREARRRGLGTAADKLRSEAGPRRASSGQGPALKAAIQQVAHEMDSLAREGARELKQHRECMSAIAERQHCVWGRTQHVQARVRWRDFMNNIMGRVKAEQEFARAEGEQYTGP